MSNLGLGADGALDFGQSRHLIVRWQETVAIIEIGR
jgi:hypothetical protein